MMISYIKWCDKGFTKSEKSSILTSYTPRGRGGLPEREDCHETDL